MDHSELTRRLVEIRTGYQTQRLNRRSAVALFAGLGLTAGSAARAAAAPTGRLAQDDATPEAPQQEGEAPPAPATPAIGEQSDGTVTWRVQVGHMDMENGMEAMAFYPDEITVNAGDRIFYDLHGLHTVTFLGDQQAPPFLVPEAQALGTPVAVDDAGRWVLNPAVAFPSGPPVHDGTGYVNSGIPDPTAQPFVLEFTAPGTFEYLCLVHPAMMKATVVVQEQSAERPHDQAYYDEQAHAQMEAVLEQGRALIEQYSQASQATPVAEGGTTWEVAAGVGEEQAQVMRFLPDQLEIHAGDTVQWTQRSGTEPHTVTFPGEAPPPELILVEPQPAGPPLLILNPEVMEPAGGPTYDGTSFANSGWLQEESVEFPEGVEFPQTWELTFDEPGEYRYYCALHAGAEAGELMGMVGTIIVT
jgi:plastocyanin